MEKVTHFVIIVKIVKLSEVKALVLESIERDS